MNIKEIKANTARVLRMIYPYVESLSTNSSIFACRDNKDIHLFINGKEEFIGSKIREIKTFKTLLAIQLDDEVVVIDKNTFDIISRHLRYEMITKKVSTRSPFALLEMYDLRSKSRRIEVYNTKFRKVVGVYDWAEWEFNGNIIITDVNGRSFRY